MVKVVADAGVIASVSLGIAGVWDYWSSLHFHWPTLTLTVLILSLFYSFLFDWLKQRK